MEKLLTVKQIIEYLPFQQDTIFKMCRAKRIPHFRIGSRVFFKQSEILIWLETKKQKPLKERGRKARFDPDTEEITI